MKKMLAIAALALFLAAHVAVTPMTLYPGSARLFIMNKIAVGEVGVISVEPQIIDDH